MPMLHSKHPSRSQVLPSVRILRDLRHIVANVKKIPVSISHGIHFAKYLAGCVTFSSTLASQALFSSYWSATLSDFLLAGHGRMVQYLQTEVLMFDPKTNCWTASWWCGFTAMCPPGYSPNTVFQGVERFNATIKSGFPNLDTAHYLTLPDAAEKACASLLANARKKGWSEDGWVPHAAYQKPCSKFLHGKWHQTERLDHMQDLQMKVPSAERYLAAMPGNMCSSSIPAEVSQACGTSVAACKPTRAYTLSFDCMDASIDSKTHDTFLKLHLAKTEEECDKVFHELELMTPDERYPSGHRLHLQKLRALATKVCQIFWCDQPYN